MGIAFNYWAASHLGKVRKSNQDSGYAGPNLLVLADGMGGPAGGDIASAVAVDYLQRLDQNVPKEESALHDLVKAEATAHDELCDHSNANPALTGLGTTCIAVLRTGDQLTLTHIGDSRAYLLRDGELYQATKDHSYVQQLVDEGRISQTEAAHHPHRSVLLRVLGDSQPNPELDTMVIDPQIGDRWLLCSDGLCGYVAEELFKQTLLSTDSPEKACEELIEKALEAGGLDNVTCVIADIVDEKTEGLPTEPIIVGSAADHERLDKLRRKLQDALQSDLGINDSTISNPITQETLENTATPEQGIEQLPLDDSHLTDSESQTTSLQTDSDSFQKKDRQDTLLEQFSPRIEEEAPRSGAWRVFLAFFLAVIIMLVVTYAVATYLGYDTGFHIKGLSKGIESLDKSLSSSAASVIPIVFS